ncbi:hypothetical protein [Chitinophaga vietnamensis]|uniref:hypothetical protein n=1 Tax=Chitinophaga vietnamensis TaxID=2593957 RepID=UPI0011776D42|nr:hypothetical protein [Chitinophaga vietnamensis]
MISIVPEHEPLPPTPDKPKPDKPSPGTPQPLPTQPPPDQPEIEPVPEEVPDRDIKRKPANPQTK